MADIDLFKKKTIWNFTTKEMRAKLKAMPGMNANIFKKWFDWYHREIINAMTDERQADNVKTELAEQFVLKLRWNYVEGWNRKLGGFISPMPFKSEMLDDLLGIYHNIIRMQQKEQRKKEIVAASQGLIAFDDVKRQFPLIAEFRKITKTKVKLMVWQNIDAEGKNIGNYCWNHYEILEMKDYYTFDEIKDACNKILAHVQDYFQKKLNMIETGKKFMESLK